MEEAHEQHFLRHRRRGRGARRLWILQARVGIGVCAQ